MVDVSLGWKVLKMSFLLLAFHITFKRLDTTRGSLKDKRESPHDFMFPKVKPHYFKCISKDVWHVYPVYKKAFYFLRHYIPTIQEYHVISITHPDGQRFTHCGSSSLHLHIQ